VLHIKTAKLVFLFQDYRQFTAWVLGLASPKRTAKRMAGGQPCSDASVCWTRIAEPGLL